MLIAALLETADGFRLSTALLSLLANCFPKVAGFRFELFTLLQS